MKEQLRKVINFINQFARKRLGFHSDDAPFYITIILAGILFWVGLQAFLELIDSLEENTLEPYDSQIFSFIRSFRNDSLTSFFRIVTDLGDRIAYALIIVALTAYLWFRHRNWKLSIEITAVLILAALSNIALKQVINRSRPEGDHLVEVATLSFPSGHSMSAMAFYGFLIYLAIRSRVGRMMKFFLVTVLLTIIISIGLSRIYLGVHYPSDVAAGMMGGLIWVTGCAVIFNIAELYRIRKKRKSNNEL